MNAPWEAAAAIRFTILPAGQPGWRSTIVRFRAGEREYRHCDHGHRTSSQAKRCAARAARNANRAKASAGARR